MAPNLGGRETESPRWFDVSPKNSARDVIHEWSCCGDEAANHQLPIAAAFWIIQRASVEECSSLIQNLMHISCSTHSVILNVTATRYTCSLNSMYHSCWRIPCSHHCSCMHVPGHSPWLASYIDVTQTTLLMLKMAGHLPDRPCINLSIKSRRKKA